MEMRRLFLILFICFFFKFNFKLIQHFGYNLVSRSSSGCQSEPHNVCLNILEGGSKVKVE